MMVDIFRTIMITTLYASVVGLIIFLVKGVLGNKLNARWHYLIWVVLILKLLLPFGPETSFSLFNVMPAMLPQSMSQMAYQMELKGDASVATEGTELTKQVRLTEGTEATQLMKQVPLTEATENSSSYRLPTQQKVKAIPAVAWSANSLPYVWAAGTVCMLLWLMFTYISFYRRLRKCSYISDERVLHIFETCKSKMSIDRNISILLQDVVGTPSLFGIIHPKILLFPAISNFSDKEIEYILLHELGHYQRKDVLANQFLLILQSVHWFNPVLWYCFKHIRQDMEVATDARVLAILENTEHKAYGRALVAILESFSEPRLAPNLLGLVDNKKNMERRIKMIKMADIFKGRRRLALIIGVLTLLGLGAMLLTNGVTKENPLPDANQSSAEALFACKTDFVGNNSKVVNLIDNLPYAKSRKEVSLETQTRPYGISVNYDFGKATLDSQQLENTFRNNAIIMFALIENVDDINFHVDQALVSGPLNFTYSRGDVQSWFGKNLKAYSTDLPTFETFLKNNTIKLHVYPEIYTPAMSSTPGIRIAVEYPYFVGQVRYTAENGTLFTDANSTHRVSTIELAYGHPVYWSPFETNGQVSAEEYNPIYVTFLDEKGTAVGEKRLTINYYDSLYNVRPALGVVIGTLTTSWPTLKPVNLDEAVSLAIKAQGQVYHDGELATEGHIILDSTDEKGQIKAYTLASFGAFGFENGIFTKVSGSGAIPTVMTFSKNEKGEYALLEYKEPSDGAYYLSSIKKMFPQKLWNKVTSGDPYPDLVKQQEGHAQEYLISIGRKATVKAAQVDKTLPNINVEASNKLFSEFTKKDPFLNNCPYWIGSREQIENGFRYIYTTSQSKTSDGYDLIVFSKTKADGVGIKENRYKIVGNDPKCISMSSGDPQH